MKKLSMFLIVLLFCFSGCVEEPYAVSKGSFALKTNDPIIQCTIVEEGVRKVVNKICFWHEDYDEKKYNQREYSRNEGGVHIWARTYSEKTEKMTAFRGAIDLQNIKRLKIIRKCGSKLYAPETTPGKRFIWVLVTDNSGNEKEYLAPADTVVWYHEKNKVPDVGESPGSIPLVEVEEITDIKVIRGRWSARPTGA